MPSKLALALCLVGLAGGCADFTRGPAPRDAGPDVATDTTLVADLTFETQVYPILLTRCQDCHQAGEMGGRTRYVLTGNARADRAMVLALVVPGNPGASVFIQRAAGDAHTGGQVLSEGTAAYDTVTGWIAGLDTSSQP